MFALFNMHVGNVFTSHTVEMLESTCIFLIYQSSDTRSQRCTDVQSQFDEEQSPSDICVLVVAQTD